MAQDGFYMGATIEIGAFEGFEKLLRRPSIMRPLLRKEIQKKIKRNFYDFPSQGKWAKWTDETVKTKVRKGKRMTGLGGGQAINQETLRLYVGSVINPIVKMVGGVFTYSVGNIGKPKKRAAWMQYGAGKYENQWSSGHRFPSPIDKPGRGNIVARPYMGLLAKDVREIGKNIETFLIAKARLNKRTIVIK